MPWRSVRDVVLGHAGVVARRAGTGHSGAFPAGILATAGPDAPPALAHAIAQQLVMAVFHHYSFADDAAGTVAEDVSQFCYAAVGGTAPARRPQARRPPVGGGGARRA
jgi:hypothetical protein